MSRWVRDPFLYNNGPTLTSNVSQWVHFFFYYNQWDPPSLRKSVGLFFFYYNQRDPPSLQTRVSGSCFDFFIMVTCLPGPIGLNDMSRCGRITLHSYVLHNQINHN
jgi:hypothetical protein